MKCSIKWCGAVRCEKYPDLNVHRFPKNPEMKAKWLDAIGIENINTHVKTWFVCSLHFEPGSINRTLDVVRLRDDTVPTLLKVQPKNKKRKRYIPSPPTVQEESSFVGDGLQLYNGYTVYDSDSNEIVTDTAFTKQNLHWNNNSDQIDGDLHSGHLCNICESEIRGFRYVCVECTDWDMCGGCEARGAHRQHYVLRLPGPRPQNEIHRVLEIIRRELFDSEIVVSRVKEETDDLESKQAPDPLFEDVGKFEDPIEMDDQSGHAEYLDELSDDNEELPTNNHEEATKHNTRQKCTSIVLQASVDSNKSRNNNASDDDDKNASDDDNNASDDDNNASDDDNNASDDDNNASDDDNNASDDDNNASDHDNNASDDDSDASDHVNDASDDDNDASDDDHDASEESSDDNSMWRGTVTKLKTSVKTSEQSNVRISEKVYDTTKNTNSLSSTEFTPFRTIVHVNKSKNLYTKIQPQTNVHRNQMINILKPGVKRKFYVTNKSNLDVK